MPTKRNKILFTIVYFTLVLFIFTYHFTNLDWTEYITKPLVLFMLLFALQKYGKNLNNNLKKGIAWGLIFSILTDYSFLLQNDIHPIFILFGFLLSTSTIISYSYAFQFANDSFTSMWNYKSVTPTHLFLSLLMISFPIIIFLVEGASSWQYPAIVYQMFLWLLITQALKRQDIVHETSYYLVLTGVFLFSITTIMLSLKTLTQSSISFGSFPVLTYFGSQFFIVIGAISQGKRIV